MMGDDELDAISEDISMAQRSAEMTRHVALDHAPQLVAEIRRLHTWDGLMSLLDEHYPVDIFPTEPDRDDRDPGPRIISLLRTVSELRGAAQPQPRSGLQLEDFEVGDNVVYLPMFGSPEPGVVTGKSKSGVFVRYQPNQVNGIHTDPGDLFFVRGVAQRNTLPPTEEGEK